MTDKEYILEVAKALLSVCDGARTLDYQGYNKYDAWKVRQILASDPTKEDIEYLRTILLKYKRQIEAMGYDYSKLLPEIQVWVEGNYLYIKTPYNKTFTEQLKKLPNRSFDFQRKVNIIRITRDKKDAQKALELLKKYFNYEPAITIPDVPFGILKLHENNKLAFDTEYDANFIQDVKHLKAYWDKKNRVWVVNPRNLKHIHEIKHLAKKYQIHITPEASDFLVKLQQHFESMKKQKQELLELSKKVTTDIEINLPEGLELYPFQKVGYEWLEKTQGRALIADEMGLGKTVQVLAWLYNHPEIRPVLVVCPNSVKLNWAREIQKWTSGQAFIIKGKNGFLPNNYQFYVINYDILADRLEQLKAMNFKMIVFDESHYIKNWKAKRTKAALELTKNVEKIVCLTGTPILNRPAELWTTLKILKPKEKKLRDFWTFMHRYADAKQTIWGWDFSGASNLDELQVLLRRSIMIRRLKKDVLKELPPKRRIMIPLEIDNPEEYNQALKDFREWYYQNEGRILEEGELLVRIEKLKQLAVKGKLETVKQYIKDILENEEKIVIFAHHRDVQKELVEHFNALWITGGMSAEQKQKVIDNFNNGARVVVVSMRAGSEGINLQKARVAIFVELGWTPSELKQAEDRIHRIGQERHVDIYYLIAEGTIEEHIWGVIQRKQRIIDEAIDGITDEEQKGILVEVLEKLVGRKVRSLTDYDS